MLWKVGVIDDIEAAPPTQEAVVDVKLGMHVRAILSRQEVGRVEETLGEDRGQVAGQAPSAMRC